MSYRREREAELFGRRIKTFRQAKFLTQAQLAAAITELGGEGVTLTRSSVANWEAGNSTPALRYRPLIADVLEHDVRLLFEPPVEFLAV